MQNQMSNLEMLKTMKLQQTHNLNQQAQHRLKTVLTQLLLTQ